MENTQENTQIINGLTFIKSTRIGECGATGDKKRIYFPFFLMGGCGEDSLVYSWNGERERLVVPKKMDYKWFSIIYEKLRQNPMLDWDWFSFSKNILRPNREHLKQSLGINDEKVDLFLEDGYVFINNFNGSFEEDGYDYEEGDGIGYYPNFKNFLQYDNLEY